MRKHHIALAVAVTAVWGLNFVLIEVGLEHFPPLLLTALRFGLSAFPAIFFVRRPGVAWKWVIAFGLVLGAVKYGLLHTGMRWGMPAGLSSLVLQVQTVFTTVFATMLLRERPGRRRLTGLAIALGGIVVAAVARGDSAPAGAFAMIIAAAAAWGIANVITRKASPRHLLSWMVWISAVPVLPLLALSLLVEGPRADLAALAAIDLPGIGAIAYAAGVSTLFGFGAWGYLISRYDATAVAPYSLLVPFFGMTSAWLFLGETVTVPSIIAAVLVVGGIAVSASKKETAARVALVR